MPVRRCVACRRQAGKDSLVRLVLMDGAVRVDARARMPGRGAYLCGQPSCSETALRREGAALRRALRAADGSGTVDVEGIRVAVAAAAADRTDFSSNVEGRQRGPRGVSE